VHPDNPTALERRVIQAAEAALAHHQYVSAIDVLVGMGLLAPAHIEYWRKGRVDCLEEEIQANPGKTSAALAMFRHWAAEKGLQPSETRYTRATRAGAVDLRFSISGNPDIERSYRTHYVSPALSERKQQQINERLSQAERPIVFQIIGDSQCSECGAELGRGSFLLMEAQQPLCLACARLDDLEYLPAGDAALTRRATKYGERTTVVVRFSRSRGRYERQGILVEVVALEKAEQECALDAEERALERARGTAARRKQDGELVVRMTKQIMTLFPACPPKEAAAIAGHTAARGSDRVGRTEAGRKLDAQALTAAVTAAVRHRHTDYDSMLTSGLDRSLARERIAGQVHEILEAWRGQD
jgi:hypothetical protein